MPTTYVSDTWPDPEGDRELAEQYAAKPYGHYKEEIYPLFAELLDAAGDDSRVLDIGAGPGHMAVDFYRNRPGSKTRFVLIDASPALLEIARQRVTEIGFDVECYPRNFNIPGWHEELGTFDVIVSNNAIFNLKPEFLAGFYGALFEMLNENGLLLNQQSFGPETPGFGHVLDTFPDVLSYYRSMSAEAAAQFRQARCDVRDDERRRTREERLAARKEQAVRTGCEVVDSGGYHSSHVPASDHVAHLTTAGFRAGVIWRKLQFAVVTGVKGEPFGRTERES